MALYARATKKALKGSDGSGTQAAETTREKLGVHNVRITFYNTLHFPFDLLPFGNFPQLKCACGIYVLCPTGRKMTSLYPWEWEKKAAIFGVWLLLILPLSQKYSASIFLPFPIICYHHQRVRKENFWMIRKRLNLSCILFLLGYQPSDIIFELKQVGD